MKTFRKKRTLRRDRCVKIDFLYLDLTVCPRCRGTDKNLRVALRVLKPVLKTMGVQTQVRKIQVKSERKARTLGFITSPTLRVNGRDIASELRESWCGSCSGVCGGDTLIDCRVWSYRGQQYAQAPVGLIVESILQEAIGTTKRSEQMTRKGRPVPANLKRYFTAKTGGRTQETGQKR